MDMELLVLFYIDDAASDVSEWRNVRIMNILFEWGLVWVYFPDLAKLLFNCNTPNLWEAA